VAGGARIRCRCRPAKAQNDKAARNGTNVGQEGHAMQRSNSNNSDVVPSGGCRLAAGRVGGA